jgi:hypothetical protein
MVVIEVMHIVYLNPYIITTYPPQPPVLSDRAFLIIRVFLLRKNLHETRQNQYL